jgi:hypothetical protein
MKKWNFTGKEMSQVITSFYQGKKNSQVKYFLAMVGTSADSVYMDFKI